MSLGIGIGLRRRKSVTVTPPQIPVFVSAEVNNDLKGVIYLEFDLEIDRTSHPDDSCFSLIVNSINVPCVFIFEEADMYIAAEDEREFAYGDTISVSYTKPLTNPLQSLSGGQVESFSESVTNNIEFTPSTQGLIFKTDFEDFDEWINDGTFSKVADDALISFDPLPNNFKRTIGGADNDGVRNAMPLKEGNTLHLFYDGSNTGVENIWMTKHASSANGGKTWSKLGEFCSRLDGVGATVTMACNGWLIKEGSYYYYYRLLSKNLYTDPSYGEQPNTPYYCDVWRASSLSGPWTWQCDIPNFAADWADTTIVPGAVIKVGSTYYLFLTGYDDAYTAKNGIASSNSLTGTFTLDNTPILTKAMIENYNPENPKVFLHPVLNKFVCLTNVWTGAAVASQTIIQISASISDWSSASLRRLQTISEMETTNVIGICCPIIKPDGLVLIGANNFVPAMYDHSGQLYTPSYNSNRTISTILIEPSRNALRFDGSVSGAIYKAQSNTDFVAEFGIQFPTNTASEIISLIYRADGTGANEYILQVQNGGAKLRLIKRVSSSNTTIETGSASQTVVLGLINRIKVVVSGTSHKAYINGQLQINSTDSALESGTHIGFSGANVVNGDIRLLSVRNSDTITINDLPEGTEVELRADGGIVAATALANSSGVATFTLNHWPMESFYVNGVNYPVIGGIWGGDVYSLDFVSLPACNKNTILTATVEEAQPTKVVITFAQPLNEDIIPETGFSLTGKTISSASISGSVLTLTVSVAYIYGNVIGNLVYTRPQSNPLRSDPDIYYIDSFTQAVTNNLAVADADGNKYTVLTIGTQTILKGNLKTTKYRNGDPITNVTVDATWAALTTEAYCWYNNDINNKAVYGAMYNFPCLIDARGIAPLGYHLMTDTELTTLRDYLGGATVAGGKLKETGTTHWDSPNTGATDEVGMSAVGSSYRNGATGWFDSGTLKVYGVIGTPVAADATNMKRGLLTKDDDDFLIGSTLKKTGVAVWCIKD